MLKSFCKYVVYMDAAQTEDELEIVLITRKCFGTVAVLIAGIVAFTISFFNDCAAEYSSAVPPVEVHSDEKGDYVIDRPFPQWVREDAAGEVNTTECVKDARIPQWALPPAVEPVRCAALNAEKTEMWAATASGVIYMDLAGKRKLYFAGRRWLPDDDVLSVGVDKNGDAYVKTAGGTGLISRRPMTLEEKALYFEQIAQERHNREGMITNSPLKTAGDVNSYYLSDDDNDGQWTEMYLAAECFRYAVTKDPEALRNARESYSAMKKLLTITPVKGYVARSVLSADKCPGADPERWRMHESGKLCWKSDTSKDELIGHYLGLPVYYDLVADDRERAEVRTLIRDLTDYIADNGFRLLDENGRVTTYGNLDPEWVNGPVGRLGDQGLNSLAALAIVMSAYKITGDEKYYDDFKRLITDHAYHRNVMKEKEISDRFQVNHDSDEMAALGFYSLLRYMDKSKLRDKYILEGLKRLWRHDLPERNPEQIIIYGAFAGKDFGLDKAVETLMEIPLDLVEWDVVNSGRKDIIENRNLDRTGEHQSREVLSYTETRTMRWSENMYQLDVRGGGRSEMVPTFWLLPYWMARYHGMIRLPDADQAVGPQ